MLPVVITNAIGALVLVAIVNPSVAGAQAPAADPQPPGGSTTSTTSTTAPTGPPTTTTIPPTTPVDDYRQPGDPTIPPQRRDELVPPPIDLISLNQLLESKRAQAVKAATQVADAANADAMSAAVDRSAALDALEAEVPPMDEAVKDARAAEASAIGGLERARSRKADLAVESYTLALSGTSATLDASAALLEDSDNFERYVRTTEYSGAAWSSLNRGVAAAERKLAQTEAATEAAIETRQQLERRIGSAQVALDTAVMNAQAVAAQGEEAIAVAAATGADLAVEGLGPTIVGETILTPEDLAAFSARRSGAAPSVDLLELARLFVLEGTAEGVRGDIAWAQSILETGNFGYRGSMVSTSDNNYAGIGACDSCASGFSYPTPQLGVRAQIQLLHTYADDNLTTADLAFPPAGKPPERSSVRGCCDTWMELSGVWATGPGYGVKILTIYNEMLAFAAQRQRDAMALAALAPPPPAIPNATGPLAPVAVPGPGG
jgi:hypothetical protein